MRLTPPLLRDPRSESPRGIAARPPVTLCAWGRPAPRADNWLRPAPAGPAFRPRRTAAKQPWAAGRRAQRRRLGSQAPAASAYAFGKARALQARATIGGAHPPDLWAASNASYLRRKRPRSWTSSTSSDTRSPLRGPRRNTLHPPATHAWPTPQQQPLRRPRCRRTTPGIWSASTGTRAFSRKTSMSGSEGARLESGVAAPAPTLHRRYDTFRHLVERECKPEDRILVVGCGNSRMSEGASSLHLPARRTDAPAQTCARCPGFATCAPPTRRRLSSRACASWRRRVGAPL